MLCFFFFKQKTADEMRISDWSSDVCSSDLQSMAEIEARIRTNIANIPGARFTVGPPDTGVKMQLVLQSEDPIALQGAAQKVERERSEERSVGKECVSTCRSRRSP